MARFARSFVTRPVKNCYIFAQCAAVHITLMLIQFNAKATSLEGRSNQPPHFCCLLLLLLSSSTRRERKKKWKCHFFTPKIKERKRNCLQLITFIRMGKIMVLRISGMKSEFEVFYCPITKMPFSAMLILVGTHLTNKKIPSGQGIFLSDRILKSHQDGHKSEL